VRSLSLSPSTAGTFGEGSLSESIPLSQSLARAAVLARRLPSCLNSKIQCTIYIYPHQPFEPCCSSWFNTFALSTRIHLTLLPCLSSSRSTHPNTHARTQARTHAHTHTRTRTHTHTCTPLDFIIQNLLQLPPPSAPPSSHARFRRLGTKDIFIHFMQGLIGCIVEIIPAANADSQGPSTSNSRALMH